MKAAEDFLRLYTPRAARSVVVIADRPCYREAFDARVAYRLISEEEAMTAPATLSADVVVLASARVGIADPQPAILRAGYGQLKPGGLLVIPSLNPSARHPMQEEDHVRPLWRPDLARRHMREAGFGEVALYVAMASAGRSTVLLSAEPKATGFYFARQASDASGWLARLKAQVRGWAARSGLLWRLEPDFIVCARK
jgi:hypothetical protein